ncbi:hypothetical protein SAMN05421837_112240 [Amycolatopsis pretoriensis]|uniref:Fe2OG dioxygenase domain-containing protein n=1 Tax=Amycolatopsis pretoriensis TaxID=218821 RepID=A0A1H5RHX0_9PSEU|nr:hypothetical protein [Amycolatopsis pretoriensis]SEF37127.1 hypothetical protein SAMN05421837_112240 [Amycolatopsis pretoriensis]
MTAAITLTRSDILGRPSFWKVSELGIRQFEHGYPPELLDTILVKALRMRTTAAKTNLNLKYLRDAHHHIPEVAQLMHDPVRLARLSELAGVPLEPYPVDFLGSMITFMGPEDGTVDWHGDSVPVTELVALSADDVAGGELAIYRGELDEGLARLASEGKVPDDRVVRVTHRVGHSIFGQLMGVLHRTAPMTSGTRVTLNLNLRSATQPHIDDQRLSHLAAESPDFGWLDPYVSDVRGRQLPSLRATTASAREDSDA